MKTNGSSAKGVALLIDADNVPAQCMQGVIEKLSGYGVIYIRRAYGNWTKPALSGWEEKLHEYAIQPMQHFDLVKGKNASDMALLIDAMDILYTKNVETFCLVSSDCDFTPLILRLRSDGKQVIVFGGKQASRSLIKSCTEFVALAGEEKAESTPVEKVKAAKAKQLKENSVLIDRLLGAVSAVQDKEGWAVLGSVGSHLGNQGSFDSRKYGFSKLSELLAATELFHLENRTNGNGKTVFVRHRKGVSLANPKADDSPAVQISEQCLFPLSTEY